MTPGPYVPRNVEHRVTWSKSKNVHLQHKINNFFQLEFMQFTETSQAMYVQ